jgi:hypothetical protein
MTNEISLSNSVVEQKESRKPDERSPSKKFLFVSEVGLIGDLAYAVRNEGNEVRYCIRSKADKDVSDGFVEKTDDWESLKDWADVIIFDDIGFGAIAERLRKDGKAVVGGTVASDRLELDRDFGHEQLKRAGLQTIPSWEFSTIDDAIGFVKRIQDDMLLNRAEKPKTTKCFRSLVRKKMDLMCLLSSKDTRMSGALRSRAFRYSDSYLVLKWLLEHSSTEKTSFSQHASTSNISGCSAGTSVPARARWGRSCFGLRRDVSMKRRW